MAVTVSSFRAAFPEFTNSPESAVVSRALADAASVVDLSAIGSDLHDRAVSYMAAHIITQDPRGERTSKSPDSSGKSAYLDTYDRLIVANVVPLVGV